MRLFLCNIFLVGILLCSGVAAIGAPVVELHTSAGVIVVELDEEKAPVTVANFTKYVRDGFYENTIFHRVIPNFMIQGGGMTSDLKEKKTNPPIKNEASNGLANSKYTIAMARTSAPDSATSQFFINTRDNAFLNYKAPTPEAPTEWGYCVFGKVIEGTEVVDAIENSKTQTVGYFESVPVTAVVITKAVLR